MCAYYCAQLSYTTLQSSSDDLPCYLTDKQQSSYAACWRERDIQP